jgi:leucyl/phenylalanyl-tRNA--protein transferase
VIPWLRGPADPLPDAALALGAASEAPGLVAAGGELGATRLAEAYAKGIFPWYSAGQPILWWSPDPRMVLLPTEFRLARSLKKTIKGLLGGGRLEVRIDSAFLDVIRACATAPREGQSGTWIVPEMIDAYVAWHDAGRVHSVETWIDGELAGGLYGVSLGRMFFGESMFARRTDASKIALAALVAFCLERGIETIDCQQRTSHLASFGGRELPRGEFMKRLGTALAMPAIREWTYDLRLWRRLGIPGPAAEDAAS